MQNQLASDIKVQKQIDGVIKDMPSFVVEWCYYLRTSDRTLLSCYDYIRKIRNFLKYINTDIQKIDVSEITSDACESYMNSCQTYKDKKGMEHITSLSYQQCIWSALNNFVDFLVAKGYTEYNYMQNIERVKGSDLEKINENRILLTKNDFNKILRASKRLSREEILKNRNTLIILLFLTTGIRKTAMSDININDINIDDKTLAITNSKNKTQIYNLSAQTIHYVIKWLEDRKELETTESGNALFITQKGDRLGDDTIYNIVKKSCKLGYGKKLSPTELRTGFCSILYEETDDIQFVQEVIGHQSALTTKRYFKNNNQRKRATKIMSDILDKKRR